jgi:hypothetical protein
MQALPREIDDARAEDAARRLRMGHYKLQTGVVVSYMFYS